MTEETGTNAAGTARSRWETARPLPGVRALRTTLRTAHLLAFASLYGGHLYGIPAARLHGALWATIASGGLLMALELYRLPLWLVQVRGLATLAKIALVALVPLWWNGRVALLSAAVVIGGVVSHMPGRFRYYSVVHGRAVGEQESG